MRYITYSTCRKFIQLNIDFRISMYINLNMLHQIYFRCIVIMPYCELYMKYLYKWQFIRIYKLYGQGCFQYELLLDWLIWGWARHDYILKKSFIRTLINISFLHCSKNKRFCENRKWKYFISKMYAVTWSRFCLLSPNLK